MIKHLAAGALALLLSGCAAVAPTIAPSSAPSVERVDGAPALTPLPMHVGGRVRQAGQAATYQWPGVYFETAFTGDSAYFQVGPGKVILHVRVDGVQVARLDQPAAGVYRVSGLSAGRHTLRLDAATESQAGPNTFGGFALAAGERAPLPARTRQIEFIGDSHTVGYGNISTTTDCTEADVWRTTDNTQAFGPVTAGHYQADYRINAISGRGVVRNYNGMAADTLPVAYPFTLFDRSVQEGGAPWQPQVVVIALGTNDFSTPLNPGERWPSRAALHADYQASYVKLVQSLRARYAGAHFVLWATDGLNGEIQDQVRKVVGQLQAAGEGRVSFVPVNGLGFTGCHAHPSVADSRTISSRLIAVIDAQPGVWQRR